MRTHVDLMMEFRRLHSTPVANINLYTGILQPNMSNVVTIILYRCSHGKLFSLPGGRWMEVGDSFEKDTYRDDEQRAKLDLWRLAGCYRNSEDWNLVFNDMNIKACHACKVWLRLKLIREF